MHQPVLLLANTTKGSGLQPAFGRPRGSPEKKVGCRQHLDALNGSSQVLKQQQQGAESILAWKICKAPLPMHRVGRCWDLHACAAAAKMQTRLEELLEWRA